jgi:tetratricopeptide (TPR) repeat protein
MTAVQPPLASPASIDAEHPWLGLSSYTEETRAYFHGRDDETAELARRVQRKNLTVLFGQSGLGKTSLLRAGLVPRLRGDGYCPVYVRVDYAPESPPPAEQIKHAIFKATAEAGHWTRPGTASEGESLWEFLHHRGDLLRDAGGRTLLPLLIFDQFEEIFTLAQADDRGRRRAREFLEDLADLVENRPPLALERRLEQDDAAAGDFDFARADYRILIALREDYLAHLEGVKGIMPSITQNRMRLARMTGAQAMSAIIRPGGRLVNLDVAEAIVRFVAGGAELANAEVEPSLLSLVCRELNNLRIARARAEISADLLAGSRETILTEFYERALEDQPPGVRRVIEDELLTESGHRESLAEERVAKALAAAGAAPDALAQLVDRRLLRIEERLDVRRVELTHDVLCSVVRASRDLRHEREARDEAERQLAAQREREAETRRTLRRTRRFAIVSAVLMLVAIAGAAFGWFNYRRAHEADLAAQKARADAEKLVGFLIEDFYKELEPTGRLETMGKLANLAVQYYDGLPPGLVTPQTQLYHGMALVRMGGVQLAASEKTEDGMRSLERARELFERRVAAGDQSEAVALGRALTLFAPYVAWGPGGAPGSKSTDLPEAAALLRPFATTPEGSREAKIVYADILNYLSHAQPRAQAVDTCEDARGILAGVGARDLTDLTAASVYADTADSQARHSLDLGRLADAERLEREVYEIAEAVLARRPGDLRSMKNRALAADLLGRIALRRGDFATALEFATRSEEASADLVRFNPGDLGSFVSAARASRRVADVLYEQGRLRDALAKLESATAAAHDERLPPGAAGVFEETWYQLAELQMKLGMRAAAERTLVPAAAASEASASLFAEGSARRRMTLGRPMAERPWLALQVGEPAAAYQGFQPVIEELDQLQFPDDDRLGRDIRGDYLSWLLRGQGDAAIQLSRYAEAEALARRRIALPDAAFGDVVRERADREQQLALALAKLGRRVEAREVLEPALEHHRRRRADGETGTEFQLSFAEAMYASAIAQEDDAAGRRARQQALEAATAELDSLSDEARQLHVARLLRGWIVAARGAQ